MTSISPTIIVTAILIAIGLSGCGPASEPTGQSTPDATNAQVDPLADLPVELRKAMEDLQGPDENQQEIDRQILEDAPKVSTAEYKRLALRTFGTSNPTLEANPVWHWMLRTAITPYTARDLKGVEHDYSMASIRNASNAPRYWCFNRFGRTEAALPDGRLISIGGEHEDYYDPDFCIFNDVVVLSAPDSAGVRHATIYTYPRDVFPPTDFATATLVGRYIVIIGSLGYSEERRATAQVFVLDTTDFSIRSLHTSGQDPGWIHDHNANLSDDGQSIIIAGGKREINEELVANIDHWALKLPTADLADESATASWTRLDNARDWRLFSIAYDEDITAWQIGNPDNLALYDGGAFANLGYPFTAYEDQDEYQSDPSTNPWSQLEGARLRDEFAYSNDTYPDRIHTLMVEGVPVEVWDDYKVVNVMVKGSLPGKTTDALIKKISKAIADSGRKVEQVHEVPR